MMTMQKSVFLGWLMSVLQVDEEDIFSQRWVDSPWKPIKYMTKYKLIKTTLIKK